MDTSVIVFLVEDEDLLCGVLQEALTDGGFAITSANTGEEAMALLDESGQGYSALITDIRLPGKLTGWDVARHARELKEGLPVIYITSSGDDWRSKGVPNSILLAKPFAPAQLVTAVSQLITAASIP